MIPPIYLAVAAVFAAATGVAWYYLLGAFAISIGFSAVGVLQFVRKRWLPGLACTMLAITSALLIYALATVGSPI